jgi:hypothetical protein
VHTVCVCVCVFVCVSVQRADDYIASVTDELMGIQLWWNYTDKATKELVQVPLCAQIWNRTWVSRKRPATNRHSHVLALASSSNHWSPSRERS